MSCLAELVELGKMRETIDAHGLRVVCVSTDSKDEIERARKKFALPFTFVSDESGSVLDALRLRHVGAGPSGRDIFYATTFVLDANRNVVFRHSATNVRDRISPDALITAAVNSLNASRGGPAAPHEVRRP